MRHPEIERIDCKVCQEFEMNMHTGELALDIAHGGNPVRRIKNMGDKYLAPCRQKNGFCHKGTPEKPNTLSVENETCIQHYRECKAVGVFPDDSVVRRNAAMIEDVERQIAREREVEFQRETLRLLKDD